MATRDRRVPSWPRKAVIIADWTGPTGASDRRERCWLQTTLLDGGRTLINNLGPGSLVADMDALLDQPASSSAEAHGDVSLWSLCKADLCQILTDHPLISLKFSNALGTRLQQVDHYLVGQRLRSVPLFSDLDADELQRFQLEQRRDWRGL